jgi:tRNA (guanine37-N1)-methyltransferase
MVMLIDPLRAAIEAARAAIPARRGSIYLSPQGPAPDPGRRCANWPPVPRTDPDCAAAYEGIDERLIEAGSGRELSIGDYVLSGGELAPAVLVDAVARLQEGALNDAESAAQDSFEPTACWIARTTRGRSNTRWAGARGAAVGQPRGIARWRRMESLGRTWLRRPDLLDERAGKADRACWKPSAAATCAASDEPDGDA